MYLTPDDRVVDLGALGQHEIRWQIVPTEKGSAALQQVSVVMVSDLVVDLIARKTAEIVLAALRAEKEASG